MTDRKPTSEQIEFARLSELLALRLIVRDLTRALPEKTLPGQSALELAEIEAALTLWLAPLPDSLLLEVRRQTKTARHVGRAQTRPFHARTQKAIAGLCNRVLAARGSIKPIAGSARDVAGIEMLAMKGLIETLLARATERDPIIDALRRIEYTGYVSLELLNPTVWQAKPSQVAELGMTALRRTVG